MKNRLAILTALCALALIGVGACLTSTVLPLPGAKPSPPVAAPGLETAHLFVAGLVALLVIGLAVWVRNLFGWIALGVVLVEGALGSHAAILHAVLAPILFASLTAVAVSTSASWSGPPVPATDLWPPLRTMSMLAPILVVVQISLGSGFRHEAIGVVWHILNAGIVLLLIMVLGVSLLRQYPDHQTLRSAAIALLTITGVQVLLGFAVYLTLLIVSENNQALVIASVVHVVTGSLTLAASTVLALELQHVTRPSLTVTPGGR